MISTGSHPNKKGSYNNFLVGAQSSALSVLRDVIHFSYKRPPLLDTEERKRIASSFKHVNEVVIQETMDYTNIIRRLKPNYVLHGDDWRTGHMQVVRQKVIDVLAEWGGELVEVPYTRGLSADKISRRITSEVTTPGERLVKLRKLLQLKPYIRAIDTSNGLTGIIAENMRVMDEATLAVKEFDALWISSLCDSAFTLPKLGQFGIEPLSDKILPIPYIIMP